MPTSLGRIDPVAGRERPFADAGPPSAHLLRELHMSLMRQRRRTFLLASPLGLLAAIGLVAAAMNPQEIGGLAPPAVIGLVAVAQVGQEWLKLRRADPVALYLREKRDAEISRVRRIAHELRLGAVRPYATLGVLTCVVAVTAVEFLWPGSMPFSEVLSRAALVKPAVRAGEWWRLLSATYLHGNLLHIVANASALKVLGQILETYEGRLRVPIAYLAGAILGSIVSTLVSSQTSIGASGGVMGIAAYVLVAAGRSGPDGTPAWLRRRMLSILGWTAAMGAAAFLFIDNGAHVGGAIGGALAALAVRKAGRRRRLLVDAIGLATAAILVAGAGFTVRRLLR